MTIKKLLFFVTFLCPLVALDAQDAYHTDLMSRLMTEYQLPNGSWLFNDTEIDNINQASFYGDIEVSTLDAVNQDFAKKVSIVVNKEGADPWASAWTIRNQKVVDKGKRLLWVIWLRSAGGGAGKVNLFAEKNVAPFPKEAFYTLPLGEEWTQYLVPFEVKENYGVNGLTFGLHLATQVQTIEIGGFAVIDYDTTVSLDQLPDKTNNDQYGGFEANASWRAEAATRIDQLRKANLNISVKNNDGTLAPNVKIDVKMIKHEYAFGTAVVACRFAENPCQNNIYEDKLINLDGKGHGFNEVVFENALKWRAWEEGWIASQPETAKAVQWLKDKDIAVRGHNLVWPGMTNMPDDIINQLSNLDYVKGRINGHMEEILGYEGIKQNIIDWDVLNEITFNRVLENAFKGTPGYTTGREIYTEIFRKAKDLAPEATLYLNDYITISQDRSSGEVYDLYKSFIKELLDAGAPLEGIGFQAHVGGFPVSIYTVYDILEDFYQDFGLESKITEFDLSPQVNDDLAAKYLIDFMTINFSHPSSKGFLMWGFWDGNHWFDNAPMYNLDWTIKPAGQAFIDQVFTEWWTGETVTSNENGQVDLRGFKGTYEVIYTKNGQEQRDTIVLSEDTNLEIVAEQTTAIVSFAEQEDVRIFPNPASDYLSIRRTNTNAAQMRIIDLNGRVVMESKIQDQQMEVQLDLSAGLYTIHWLEADKVYYQKLLVQ